MTSTWNGVWVVLLLLFCSASTVYSIVPISVLRAAPATSPVRQGVYDGGRPEDSLRTSTANTRITLRLSEEDGVRDPRRFFQNIVNFTTELVDESNRVVPMDCGVEFSGSHVTYSVQLVEWIPVVQRAFDIPILTERATAAESWTSEGHSVTDGIVPPGGTNDAGEGGGGGGGGGAAGRRLFAAGERAEICTKPGFDEHLCWDPQDPLVLGKTLDADQFNSLLARANGLQSNVDLIVNPTSGTATMMQNAQLQEMQDLLESFQNASKALAAHQLSSSSFHHASTAEYDLWQKKYNRTAAELNDVLASANNMVANGAARTKTMFDETSALLLAAQANIDQMATDDPERVAFYNSYVLQMATIVQSLIHQIDMIQLENDNDYLMEQALSILMQNVYGNVRVRRTLARLFQLPTITDDPYAEQTTSSVIQTIADARNLDMFLESAMPAPDVSKITPYYFEVAFAWNTFLDYGKEMQAGTRNYWDVDVDASLVDIQPTLSVPGVPATPKETARKLINAGGAGSKRRYANYRRFDVYCSEAHIVSLQNSWSSVIQLQQMLGPPGCSVAAGTCRCWAYVRRQRCTVPWDQNEFTRLDQAHIRRNQRSPTETRNNVIPQSLAELNAGCLRNEDVAAVNQPNWFNPSDDDARDGSCTQPSGGVNPPSASNKPSCEMITDIVAFNREIEQICNNTVRGELTDTVTTSNMPFAMWVNTRDRDAVFINATHGYCSTNFQIMAVQANTQGETVPFALYTQQQTALTYYVKLASRAFELRTHGYVPKHGVSREQPYYVQGPMREADTRSYIEDIQNGVMTRTWSDPVRTLRTQTMTYGAISPINIPVYRFTRQERTQRISLACRVPGIEPEERWVTQTAQDVAIDVDSDSFEPTTFTWVGWLDDMYLPADHDFATFRNGHGQIVNRTRYTFAVPDEAISAGGPLETREHKIDYVRCGLSCLEARAIAIDPTYTVADLTQKYNGDPLSIELDGYLRDQGLPGITFNDAVNQQRATGIKVEEFLRAEKRQEFSAAAMGDSAHHYFHPLILEDASRFLTQQDLDIGTDDPATTPIVSMSGPIPLRCDMAWFETHNIPPTKQCRFLETHRPIATLDDGERMGAFRSWDQQGFMQFADTSFSTTFSFVVAGMTFVGNADAIVTCPPPHMIQLVVAKNAAAPQLRLFNDKLYNVSIHIHLTPSASSALHADVCVPYDTIVRMAPHETVIATLPFASTCDGLAIQVSAFAPPWTNGTGAADDDDGLLLPSDPTQISQCWNWHGNMTMELDRVAHQQLHASRVAAGRTPASELSVSALQSGLDQTTQLLAQQVSANEMARINNLFASMKTYNTETAKTMLRILNTTQGVGPDDIPTNADVDAFRRYVGEARLSSSNLRALILASAAKSAAGYADVVAGASEAELARAAFARTSAEVMANLSSTAQYLHDRLFSSQSLRDRANASLARFQNDLLQLERDVHTLQSIVNVYGTIPLHLVEYKFETRFYLTFPNVWDAFRDNVMDVVGAIPGVVVGLVKDLIEFAVDLTKDILCEFIPFMCDDTIFTIIIIIVCIIVLVVIGFPLIKMCMQARTANAAAKSANVQQAMMMQFSQQQQQQQQQPQQQAPMRQQFQRRASPTLSGQQQQWQQWHEKRPMLSRDMPHNESFIDTMISDVRREGEK